MDRERLQVLPFEAIQDVARKCGIDRADEFEKAGLIDQILEVIEEDRFDRERSNNIEMLVKKKKFELNPNDSLEYAGIEEQPLPKTYDETRIVFMLRDPNWAFAYWDLESRYAVLAQDDEETSSFFLRVWEAGDSDEEPNTIRFEIPLTGSERTWYVNLPRTGRKYFVDLVLVLDLAFLADADTETVEVDTTHVRSAASGISGNGNGDTGHVDRKDDYPAMNQRVLCRSNVITSPEATLEDLDSDDELGYAHILSVAGLHDIEEFSANGVIPQRIISLLDTQYLHLKG